MIKAATLSRNRLVVLIGACPKEEQEEKEEKK